MFSICTTSLTINSLNKRKLRKIIEYAITDPGPESESNPLRAYKYPFVAGELLSLTNGPLLNLYFSTEAEEEPEESAMKAAKKGLAVKVDENNEVKGTVALEKESLKQEGSDLNVVEDLEEDWEDDTTQEPTSIKKAVKKKLKRHSKFKRRHSKLPRKRTRKHHSMRGKKMEPECMQEDQKVVAPEENQKAEETKIEPEEKKKQEQISEPTLENTEPTQGIEDLDIDSGAINDNATIVSDEGGNNSYGGYELVYMLFAFVDVESDIELNELLAGYFKGAALALLNGKPKEMAEFLENNLHVMDNLVIHSNNKSIAEVLCKAISIDDEYFTNPTQFNETRKTVLNKLLNQIEDTMTDKYSVKQFAQTFCDLCDQSKEVSAISCCMEFVRRIFAICFNDSSPIASAGVTILTRLLAKDKSHLRVFVQEQLNNASGSDDPQTEELLKLFEGLLTKFRTSLEENEGKQINQFGIEVHSFGLYRLKIIECIHTLINLNVYSIIDQIHQMKYPKLLCDLFVLFPFNSVLHSIVYAMYKSVLDSENKTLLYIVILYYSLLVHP